MKNRIKISLSLLLFAVAAESAGRQLCVDMDALETVPPKYPVIESPKGHSGYVVVEFVIDYKGDVISPKVKESYSEPTDRFAKPFGKMAIEAIKNWKFNPRQIACEAEHKFVFKLSE